MYVGDAFSAPIVNLKGGPKGDLFLFTSFCLCSCPPLLWNPVRFPADLEQSFPLLYERLQVSDFPSIL